MAEPKEDPEQLAKHQEIIDILVASGYFRARIKGLDVFDKIVGGMVYLIEALDEAVDVDLLFHDSLSIGQKIALLEKIVIVLPRLKCPYTIEPHQIQGLDYIAIFPVIQWLVRRSVENRAEKAETLFNFAVNQFHNDFELESSKLIAARCDSMLQNIADIESKYQPKRRFKRKDVAEDENVRVRVTLMEYARGAIETSQGIQEQDVADLLSDLTLKEDIEKLEFDEETRAEVFDSLANLATEFSKDDKEIEYQRQLILLKATKSNLEKRLAHLREENTQMTSKKEQKMQELSSLKANKDELKEEVKNLKEKHSTEDKETIEKLTSLLQLTEQLKQNETKFKQECNETMIQLQNEIQEYERLAGDENAEEDNRILLESEKRKLQGIRMKMAKKNRQIVVLQRRLDNVPSRSELAQYQRRFMELYNQVSAKHRETKQFYTLYNTLSDKKLYMEKEISLLNSIYENFNAALMNVQLREQFLKQLEGIVVGVKETKVRLQKRNAQERIKKEKLNEEFVDLMEEQRKYAAAINQLKQILLEDEFID